MDASGDGSCLHTILGAEVSLHDKFPSGKIECNWGRFFVACFVCKPRMQEGTVLACIPFLVLRSVCTISSLRGKSCSHDLDNS